MREPECPSSYKIPFENLRVIFPTFPILYLFFFTTLSLILRILLRLAGIFRWRDSYLIPRCFAAPSNKPVENEFRSARKDVRRVDEEPLNIYCLKSRASEVQHLFANKQIFYIKKIHRVIGQNMKNLTCENAARYR